MDLTYWLIFSGTVIGVSLIPGPSTFIAFAHGASHGWLRSLATACGNASASTLQAIAASAGLGLILTSSALLFAIVKYAGALYLIYVGIQLWRSAARRVSLGNAEVASAGSIRKLYSGGFAVAVSNPKAIAFFTALFPQFLSPDGNDIGQLMGMVLVVCGSAFAVAAAYGGLGAYVRGLELSRLVMTRVYKTTGGLFVASGVGLAASRA
ncbi:LysE family translocator [Rhodovulum sulfidophilum]|uniref:LysE family translocator n=1 Tax=Rhodovulum sulfidophilum TaxID=35806 RepID=UPI000950E800|nr:LysE family translocator [Rhodovulum sulfidophilum]MBL3553167.1 LysE family translocator [Rhodovulum sulfidophilum]MCE8417596.1 LysE family translocator [Rhodovulum sulfidophilum]OLS50217.1 lysine transporter LysE [Rhodovulum sulfidophilum]